MLELERAGEPEPITIDHRALFHWPKTLPERDVDDAITFTRVHVELPLDRGDEIRAARVEVWIETPGWSAEPDAVGLHLRIETPDGNARELGAEIDRRDGSVVLDIAGADLQVVARAISLVAARAREIGMLPAERRTGP